MFIDLKKYIKNEINLLIIDFFRFQRKASALHKKRPGNIILQQQTPEENET